MILELGLAQVGGIAGGDPTAAHSVFRERSSKKIAQLRVSVFSQATPSTVKPCVAESKKSAPPAV